VGPISGAGRMVIHSHLHLHRTNNGSFEVQSTKQAQHISSQGLLTHTYVRWVFATDLPNGDIRREIDKNGMLLVLMLMYNDQRKVYECVRDEGMCHVRARERINECKSKRAHWKVSTTLSQCGAEYEFEMERLACALYACLPLRDSPETDFSRRKIEFAGAGADILL